LLDGDVQPAQVNPKRISELAFFGPTVANGHCGHGWTCSLPRPVENDPKQTFSAVQEATAARLTCWYFCPQLFVAALLIGSSLVG
jgi:hypothetical protein